MEYKVFQIGFNKTATVSFCELFEKSGYKSIHCWGQNRTPALAVEIFNNFLNFNPILSNIDDFDFYSDMECLLPQILRKHNYNHPLFAYTLYKEIYNQYPSSKFILNIRPVDDWIRSRAKWGRLLAFEAALRKQSKEDVIAGWRRHYHRHISDVLSFFESKPNQLLVYDISKDRVDKIISFFHDINLNPKHWHHLNKTRN